MTRKRTRENLVQTLCEPCPYCERKGYVLSEESVAHKVLREIQKDLPRFGGRQLAVTVSRRVAEQLLGPASSLLEALEERLGRKIEVRARADMHQEQFELTSLDEPVPVSFQVPWLDTQKPPAEPETPVQPRSEAAEAPEAPGAEEGPAEMETTPAPAPTPEEAAAAPEEPPAAPEAMPQPVDATGESPILRRFAEET
jgi:hypothetical protein